MFKKNNTLNVLYATKRKKYIYILRAFQTTTQSMKNNLFF